MVEDLMILLVINIVRTKGRNRRKEKKHREQNRECD